jgi:hypothetical protein
MVGCVEMRTGMLMRVWYLNERKVVISNWMPSFKLGVCRKARSSHAREAVVV